MAQMNSDFIIGGRELHGWRQWILRGVGFGTEGGTGREMSLG